MQIPAVFCPRKGDSLSLLLSCMYVFFAYDQPTHLILAPASVVQAKAPGLFYPKWKSSPLFTTGIFLTRRRRLLLHRLLLRLLLPYALSMQLHTQGGRCRLLAHDDEDNGPHILFRMSSMQV